MRSRTGYSNIYEHACLKCNATSRLLAGIVCYARTLAFIGRLLFQQPVHTLCQALLLQRRGSKADAAQSPLALQKQTLYTWCVRVLQSRAIKHTSNK